MRQGLRHFLPTRDPRAPRGAGRTPTDGCLLVTRSARKRIEGRTKTRKRRVYLCDHAFSALREQISVRRPNPHGLVFPSPRSDDLWKSDNLRADVFAKAVK